MFKLTKQLRKLLIATMLAATMLLGIGCGVSKVDNGQGKRCGLGRPAEWATPIAKDGLPNFHKVSQNLYRGASRAQRESGN